MVDKTPKKLTREDKITEVKEFYACGDRNYVVDWMKQPKIWSILWTICQWITELMYDKKLIELTQTGENGVLELPDKSDDEKEKTKTIPTKTARVVMWMHLDWPKLLKEVVSVKVSLCKENNDNNIVLHTYFNFSIEGDGSCCAGISSSFTYSQPGPSKLTSVLNGHVVEWKSTTWWTEK